jgi:YegS/Rv2252/BmrU family lipid kinase
LAILGERVLLIVNPGSRGGLRLMQPAVDAFRAENVEVDVIITESPGHGGRVAREFAEEYDLIFTLGGDGTAMEVVDAMSGTNRSVGILAGGTGNVLARTLGIPLDVRRAVPALLHGTRRQIDLGVLGDGRRFALSAGTGLDAALLAGAPLHLRRRLGVLAYVASGASAVWHRDAFAVRAAVDGRVVERDDCVVAMIVNVGAVLDGLLPLAPGATYDDGLLDLCLFSTRHIGDALAIAARLALHDFREDRLMTFARGRRIALEAVPPRAAQADGELIGLTPLVAEVAPLAALLVVPR